MSQLGTSSSTGIRRTAPQPRRNSPPPTEGRLRLIFLPGYSPELNPDEWVWKIVKHDRIGKTGVTSKDDLRSKAVGALRRLQKRPGLVRAFFAYPHRRYITALTKSSRLT